MDRLGVFSFIVGLSLLLSAGSGDDGLMITGIIVLGFSIVFIGLFFYTRIARISFRLADEQDYDVLLASSAVKNSELMQKFIQKMLMNSMNVEEEIQTITLEEQLMTPKTEVAQYQPPVQQQVTQPVQQMSAQPVDVPQTQAVAPAMETQPVTPQPVQQATTPASSMGETSLGVKVDCHSLLVVLLVLHFFDQFDFLTAFENVYQCQNLPQQQAEERNRTRRRELFQKPWFHLALVGC